MSGLFHSSNETAVRYLGSTRSYFPSSLLLAFPDPLGILKFDESRRACSARETPPSCNTIVSTAPLLLLGIVSGW